MFLQVETRGRGNSLEGALRARKAGGAVAFSGLDVWVLFPWVPEKMAGGREDKRRREGKALPASAAKRKIQDLNGSTKRGNGQGLHTRGGDYSCSGVKQHQVALVHPTRQ